MDKITQAVENKKDEMIKFLMKLCSIPAVNPAFGGTGEYKKAMWLLDFLKAEGIPVEVIEVEDPSVPEGKRINIISLIPGEDADKTLWIIGHLDTVAPGSYEDWETDPMVPVVKDGRVYGRGVEDNGQAIVCMVYATKIIKELGLKPRKNLGLVFVSDEESGSTLGLKYLASKEIFKAGDEALVPDAGSPDGSFVEVAEKSILWCKFTVVGKETHASWPHMGNNAGWVGSLFGVELVNMMREKYRDRDNLYDPPYSTFELTQKFSNVSSPNVVPGKDIFVVDFRVLPQWKLDDIITDIDKLITKYEYLYKVKISYEFPQRVDAPIPTSPEAPIVKSLVQALKRRNIEPVVGGIGGGTCAAVLRRLGIPAVVWSTVDELAHQPNEYAVIENIVADTETFISLILDLR